MAKKGTNGTEIVVPQQGTSLALPDDLIGALAGYAKAATEVETVPGQFFGTKGGILTFGGQVLPGADVIVLRAMFERTFYPSAYNPDLIESPRCFGFSHTGYEDMLPHDNATEKQAESCAECRHNQWTLDPRDNKRRIPCKMIRRLSCIPMAAADDAAKAATLTGGYLRVPVTSTKHWAAYTHMLATQGKPPFAVVTHIALLPDPRNQVRYEFTKVRDVTDAAALRELMKRYEAEEQVMAFPYEKTIPIVPAAGAAPPQEARKF